MYISTENSFKTVCNEPGKNINTLLGNNFIKRQIDYKSAHVCKASAK